MATPKTGVYRIRHVDSGKSYIGSAASARGIRKRWSDHKLDLSKQQHHSRYLQRAWNKYGADSFVFEVLLYCDPKNCLMYEQTALDYYKPEYNCCPTAGSTLGFKHSEATKHKISRAMSGENHPMHGVCGEKHYNYGKKHSEETKQRMSNTRSGRKNARYGKEVSQETRLKMSIRKRRLSDESFVTIKQMLLDNEKVSVIAKRLGVAWSTIKDIKVGRTWRIV